MQTGVTIYKCNFADPTVSILKDGSLLKSCLDHVHPDDKGMVSGRLDAGYIGNALKDAPGFEFQFRVVQGVRILTFRCFVSRADEDNCAYLGLEDITGKVAEQEENERRARETDRLIERLSRSYKILHLVNLSDGTYCTLKMDDGTIGKGLELPDFSKATSFFVNQVVFEADRNYISQEMDFDTIRHRLASDKSYSVEFRTLVDGVTFWNTMAVSQISEDVVTIGFAENDIEIVTNRLAQKFNDDYFVLFVVDADTGLMKVVKEPKYYKTGKVGETIQYSKAILEFAQRNEGETREFFTKMSNLDFAKESFGKEDRNSYSYKSTLIEGGPWVTASSYVLARHDDGSVASFSLGFSRMDSFGSNRLELQNQQEKVLTMTRSVNRQLSEQKHMLDFFLKSYDSAYYVDLIEESMQVLHMDHIFSEFMNLSGRISDMADFIEKHVHPDDRELIRRFYDKDYVASRIRKEGHFTFQLREIHGGMKRTFRGHVIKGADEYHVLLAFMDISEELRREKQQQEQLQQALSMAQSANRAKTTFLNNMSHDIRTPMNAIIGYAGLALSHMDRIDQVEDYLGKIDRSSKHLLSLINDVLDMSRIESGKVNIEVKPENLSDIVHYLSDIIQQGAQSKKLDFHVKAIDVRHENVLCDKLRLNQVLLNLLSNSVKYTPQGGSVIMSVWEKPSKKIGFASYEFTVRDTGIGMSDDFLQVIFDPFTRDKSSTVSGIQGTGLGMAITKNLVDLMDGRIRLSSELGKGTEVTVTFDFKVHSDKNTTTGLSKLKGLKVLVANNDSLNYKAISNMLFGMGMSSEWSQTGKNAMTRTEQAAKSGKPFDAFIIDRLLPDIDGIELTRRIRQTAADNAIVILTAYDWQDIEDDALKAGVNGFVEKPVFQSDLLSTFENFLVKNKGGAEEKADTFNIEGKKILLVEDNELNREIATAILEEYGCIITTAEDGDIAVEKMKSAKAGDWDIVLMDIQMPRLNGYDATRQIRALDTEISRIPIVAMTANAFDEDRRKAIEAGMNEHFAKPIDVDKLKAMLSKFLS